MRPTLLALLLGTSTLPAGSLLLSDNFNAPDTNNFDQSDQTGRRSGLFGPDVQLRSSRVQHHILANRLDFLNTPAGGSGRIRFQQVAALNATPPTDVWTNFAAGVVGTTVLAEGGLRISFDWLPPDNNSTNWISFNAGIAAKPPVTTPPTAEPATRVNHAGTDFGILFRDNGGTQCFLNGALAHNNNTAFPAPAIITIRKVVITLAFTSFADGSNVSARATVDGVSVLPDGYIFPWSGNLGIIHMELGNTVAGTKLDNLAIAGLNGLSVNLAAQPFYTSISNNGVVGTFTSELNNAAAPSTYALIAGEGDVDNAKFKIAGNELQSNGFNFLGIPEGTNLSVRIKGTSSNSAFTSEQVFQLSVIADEDEDDLPDSWELAAAFNLFDLKGRNPGPGPGAGTGNFDGDGLTDLQEFQLIRGLYPLLSPFLADTDSDGLGDAVELGPVAPRLISNPTLADTDGDGLSDLVENNSGNFVSAAQPGTSPVDYDSDDDSFPDQYEITRGSSPLDPLQLPTLPAPLTTSVLTTDETSGISSAKTYTHAISGGYAATINGVGFTPLRPAPAVSPDDFIWAATNNAGNTATFNEIAAFNLGEWLPANGNVTGTGLLELLGGFAYSGSGDLTGSSQTYTLTGLVPGQKYELRLYVRVWSKVASGRPLSVTFANGAQSVNAYILQDRPGIMLGDSNPDSAYALVFPYTAEAAEMAVTAAVPFTTLPISGSWHLYGLTNESVSPVGFDITGLTYQRTPVPAVTLTFDSVAAGVYAVDFSTALNAAGLPGGWTTLTNNLASQGQQTTYTDTSAAGSAARIFYRVRRLSP